MSGNVRARLGKSSWIHKDPDALGISKHMRRNILYFRKMVLATPKWVNHAQIVKIYKESRRKRLEGQSVCVDHIVPLNHKYVCGLHWHGNLQVISEKENELKSNHYWPDMWHEQFELFELAEAEQYELQLSM